MKVMSSHKALQGGYFITVLLLGFIGVMVYRLAWNAKSSWSVTLLISFMTNILVSCKHKWKI